MKKYERQTEMTPKAQRERISEVKVRLVVENKELVIDLHSSRHVWWSTWPGHLDFIKGGNGFPCLSKHLNWMISGRLFCY